MPKEPTFTIKYQNNIKTLLLVPLIEIGSKSRETPSFKFNAENAEDIIKVISKSPFTMVIKIHKNKRNKKNENKRDEKEK